ncbi:hypothetical protein C8F04DRAFT_1355699 [Mycena alexandri]|uniref:Uncharacterized protein n=1 Tax=Mycena alexandri TaxID=1745969 RepID=A0AAD6SWG7_9AGAR|nr:hypothetical protein C8F04DRAFT_1355699 [Mycena alexandri]
MRGAVHRQAGRCAKPGCKMPSPPPPPRPQYSTLAQAQADPPPDGSRASCCVPWIQQRARNPPPSAFFCLPPSAFRLPVVAPPLLPPPPLLPHAAPTPSREPRIPPSLPPTLPPPDERVTCTVSAPPVAAWVRGLRLSVRGGRRAADGGSRGYVGRWVCGLRLSVRGERLRLLCYVGLRPGWAGVGCRISYGGHHGRVRRTWGSGGEQRGDRDRGDDAASGAG